MDMKRVEEIEKMDIQLHKDKIDFLIQTIKQQQDTLNKIEESWLDIEENGSQSDIENFYTVVQDILHDHHQALEGGGG